MGENIFNQIFRRLSALEKNQSSSLFEGEVVEIDENKGLVRVDDGAGTISDWVKVAGHKSKGVTSWDFPEIGQSMIIQNNGQRQFAIYGGFSDNGKQNASNNQKKRLDCDDGAYFEYDKSSGAMDINLISSLNLTIGGTTIKITDGEVSITGANLKLPKNDATAVNLIASSSLTFGAAGGAGSMSGTGNMNIKGKVDITGKTGITGDLDVSGNITEGS